MDEKYKIGDKLEALYLSKSWDKAIPVNVIGYGYLTEQEAAELQETGVAVNAGDLYYDCNSPDDTERVTPFFEFQLRPK